MNSSVLPSYRTRANSASSMLNISVPYSNQSGSSSSQSEPELKVYPFDSSSAFIFSNPYSSPLHTTLQPSFKKGCIPSSVRPMIASLWNPIIPLRHVSGNLSSINDVLSISCLAVSISLVSSGPLYLVRAKASSNSGFVMRLPVVVINVHISAPPYFSPNSSRP